MALGLQMGRCRLLLQEQWAVSRGKSEARKWVGSLASTMSRKILGQIRRRLQPFEWADMGRTGG